ncbi:MAG: Gfo/Idh/MocA family oxidoreductase [Ktedonobacteraceae bacterium]|nr:Gfo/Idh/MocA family oxidoreductase [Ktedonobacteraceae bacterium]
MSSVPNPVNFKPQFPATYHPGIGIIGCGEIVQIAHLPAYKKYGVNVVGAYDISSQATQAVHDTFGVRIFSSVDELLAHPEIEVVDIATHPAARVELVRKALRAGKHVLSQKPFALDIPTAQLLIAEARDCGRKLAVNQNGRWAPAWRVATLLVEQGMVSDVLAITHLYEISFEQFVHTPFDAIPHFGIYDYSVHWLDITRCWMGETPVQAIRAREYRTPNQPVESKANWGMWIEIAYENGASAFIRGVNCLETPAKGHSFWIHGRQGSIHGRVEDLVEIERGGTTTNYQLEGRWFPDGFAGTMGELLSAIAEEREPYNSAQHNLLSLQMTLAACRSSEEDSRAVSLEEVLK